MSLKKENYTFKDKTWYIVPWKLIDPDIPEIHSLPSYLVHDVDGCYPHRITLWNYGHLNKSDSLCWTCGCKPSKKIQTLWTLENMDNPDFYEDYDV
ncbi:hypothetical protein LCGC14_2971710 [marine sediment metagenome]|uniref:Uncharacterized protein n=1 Tax=marine sediment metagenome TaxID=412755 RepID=A0A0F8X966_9ZZZZ